MQTVEETLERKKETYDFQEAINLAVMDLISGSNTRKECHKTESLWNHTTTDHKEGEQSEDRRNVGENSCNCGDGTDQRVQSLMLMLDLIST